MPVQRDFDLSQSFSSVWSFVSRYFWYFLEMLDHIKLINFGDYKLSVLQLFVGFMLIGIVISALVLVSGGKSLGDY